MTDTPNPEMPPPGWYPDPVTGTGHRFWNGFAWTEEHSLDPGGSGGGLQPVGPWMGETFRLLIDRAGHLFTLIVVLSVPTGLLAGAALYAALKDGVIVLETDSDDALTGIQFEGFEGRALAVAALVTLVNFLASFVLAAAVSRHVVFARTERAESWSASLLGGLRRAPRVLGVSILVGLIFVVGILAALVVSSLYWLLLLLTIPLLIYAGFRAWTRLSLATTAAAVAPTGVRSTRTSVQLTKSFEMAILGRLLLLLLFVLAAQLIAGSVSAPFASSPPVDVGDTEVHMIDLMGGSLAVFGFQQVVGALAGGFAAAVYGAGMAVLYLDLGGPLDDEFAMDPQF